MSDGRRFVNLHIHKRSGFLDDGGLFGVSYCRLIIFTRSDFECDVFRNKKKKKKEAKQRKKTIYKLNLKSNDTINKRLNVGPRYGPLKR